MEKIILSTVLIVAGVLLIVFKKQIVQGLGQWSLSKPAVTMLMHSQIGIYIVGFAWIIAGFVTILQYFHIIPGDNIFKIFNL